MIKHHIELLSEQKIIYVKVSGVVDVPGYKQVSENVAAIYNKNKYNVLYDLYDTKVDLSVDESANVAREVKGKQTATAHEIHIAAYVSIDNYHDWKFIEIFNIRMGYDTKAFLDKDEALEWLLEQKSF